MQRESRSVAVGFGAGAGLRCANILGGAARSSGSKRTPFAVGRQSSIETVLAGRSGRAAEVGVFCSCFVGESKVGGLV